MFHLEKRRLKGGLLIVSDFSKEDSRGRGSDLLAGDQQQDTRKWKMHVENFPLDFR